MLKLSKLMGALILAGLVQGAQDAQDVLKGGWPLRRLDQVIVEQVNRGARGVGAGFDFYRVRSDPHG